MAKNDILPFDHPHHAIHLSFEGLMERYGYHLNPDTVYAEGRKATRKEKNAFRRLVNELARVRYLEGRPVIMADQVDKATGETRQVDVISLAEYDALRRKVRANDIEEDGFFDIPNEEFAAQYPKWVPTKKELATG